MNKYIHKFMGEDSTLCLSESKVEKEEIKNYYKLKIPISDGIIGPFSK